MSGGLPAVPPVRSVRAHRLRFDGLPPVLVSNEGNPLEPIHVHFRSPEKLAKFWLEPLSLAENFGFNGSELKDIEASDLGQYRRYPEELA